MKSLKNILISLCVIIVVSGCSKGGSGSDTSTATTSVSGYTVSNGQCYNSANQSVDSSYCSNISNYYQVNSYCYNTSGERVDDRYCKDSSSLTLPPRQCNGRFFTPHQGKKQEIRCQDRNCHGNLVFDERGNPVHCR